MRSLQKSLTKPRLVLVAAVAGLLAVGIVGPAAAAMGGGTGAAMDTTMVDPSTTGGSGMGGSGMGSSGDMSGTGTMPGGTSTMPGVMPGVTDGGPAGSMPGAGDMPVGHATDGTMGPGAMGPVDGMGGTDAPGWMMPGSGDGMHEHMFSDVASGDWYHSYAEHMADQGFMMGYANGQFGGYDPITRGQFAVIMGRMMGLTPGDGSGFADMQDFWGADMVSAMVDAGIIHGYEDGMFHPYDTITRAQMAAIMDRAWEYMHGDYTPTDHEMDVVHQQLHDVMGMWADEHIAHMYALGVVQGDQMGRFRPWESTNRAQAGAMMWRWYELDHSG